MRSMTDLDLPNFGDHTPNKAPQKEDSAPALASALSSSNSYSKEKLDLVKVDDQPNSEANIQINPTASNSSSRPVTSVQFQTQTPSTPKTDLVSLLSDSPSPSRNTSQAHHRHQRTISSENGIPASIFDNVGQEISTGAAAAATTATTSTIQPKHVVNIFRHSVTTAAVTPMEIRRVKHMHDRISEGVDFSFNYNCLLFVAAMVAGLGLVSNATATIIASMLLSPIMGPVVGMAYGVCISDYALAKRALRNEILSLIFCIFAGVLIACCTGWTDLHEAWPTPEMLSRASTQSLLVSIPVAFFSGLGVAISILDDQTSSLVGVAISASLLPPAVNAGILWTSWIFLQIDNDFCSGCVENLPDDNIPACYSTDGLCNDYVGPEQYNDNGTIIDGVDEDAIEQYTQDQFRKMGATSLAITFANIALIIASSILMFRMKENLPLQSKKEFWTDLKTARRIYQNRAFLWERNEEEEEKEEEESGEDDYDINTMTTPPSSPKRSVLSSSWNKKEEILA